MSERLGNGTEVMNVTQIPIKKIADLPFGEGVIGGERHLDDDFARALGDHTRVLTQTNLADCGDGRGMLRLLEMESGLVLVERVVPQILGGTFLGSTKAAVAADAALVRDAKDFQDAYEKVAAHLTAQGEEDTAHEDCGASKSVEKSVATRIDAPAFLTSMYLFTEPDEQTKPLIMANLRHKRERLLDGFYGGWDSHWQLDHVSSKFPQNVAYLDTGPEDSATHGHYEEAIYPVFKDHYGFAKNAFVHDTGRQAFAVTIPKMRDLAYKLSGSRQEEKRIYLAFIDDTLHISNCLAATGTPIVGEAA
jgi:hypothetical protein